MPKHVCANSIVIGLCLQTWTNIWVNPSSILRTSHSRIESHVNHYEINVNGHKLEISHIWSHDQCLHNKLIKLSGTNSPKQAGQKMNAFSTIMCSSRCI